MVAPVVGGLGAVLSGAAFVRYFSNSVNVSTNVCISIGFTYKRAEATNII